MINRIREIRVQKGLTLADVAAACTPPTTAQTIGRLETGMRNLSLAWMNRIAGALGVQPELLLATKSNPITKVVAVLTDAGVEAPKGQREAVLPTALAGEGAQLAMAVEIACGEYRGGDQIWLREVPLSEAGQHINRDVLAPIPAGQFAFGRLFDSSETQIKLLPATSGQEQIVVDNPPWMAVAEMLVRAL